MDTKMEMDIGAETDWAENSTDPKTRLKKLSYRRCVQISFFPENHLKSWKLTQKEIQKNKLLT